MKRFFDTGHTEIGMCIIWYYETEPGDPLVHHQRLFGAIDKLENNRYRAYTYVNKEFKVGKTWKCDSLQEAKNKILGIEEGSQLSLF